MPNNQMDFILKKLKDEGRMPEDPKGPSAVFETNIQNDKTQVRGSFSIANTMKPEKQAEVLGLSKRFGVHPSVVENDLDFYTGRKQQEAVNYDSLARNNPRLTKFLKDPNKAAVAQDDLDSLKRITDKRKRMGSFEKTGEKEFVMPTSLGRAGQTGWNQLESSSTSLAVAFGVIEPDAAADFASQSNATVARLQEMQPDYAKDFKEMFEKNTEDIGIARDRFFDGIIAASEGDMKKYFIDVHLGALGTVMQFEDLLLKTVTSPFGLGYTVTESLAHSLPSLILGGGGALVANVPGFVVGGFIGEVPVEIGASLNEDLAKRGVDVSDRDQLFKAYSDPKLMGELRSRATRKGLTTAMVSALFNSIGGKALAKTKGLPLAKRIVPVVSEELPKQFVEEFGGELLGRTAREKGAITTADVGESFFEGVAGVGHSVGDIVIGSSARKAFSKNRRKATSEVVKKSKRAFQTVNNVESLKDTVAAVRESKTEDRLPGTVKELLDTSAGGAEVEQVYFQTKDWDSYWRNKGESPVAAAENIFKDGGRAYSLAKESSSLLEIPVADYISTVYQTEDFEGLLGVTRTVRDGPTLSEASKALDDLGPTVDDLAAEVALNEQIRIDALAPIDQQAAKVGKIIESQLKNAGNSPDVSAQNASTWERTFRSIGVRLNKDPMEIYNRFRPKVNSFLQEGKLPVEPQEAAQSSAVSPEIQQSLDSIGIDAGQVTQALQGITGESATQQAEQSTVDEIANDEILEGIPVEPEEFFQRPIIDFNPLPNLFDFQVEAQNNFAELLSSPEAVGLYETLPETMGGKVLNKDEARLLMPEYAASILGATLHTPSTHGPAGAFVDRMFEDKLAQPVTGQAMFLAGGAGSGKTFIRQSFLSGLAAEMDVIVDGTFNKQDKALSRLNAALDSGRNVTIVMIYNEAKNASRLALKRWRETGRWVPASEIAKAHVEAVETFLNLSELFENDPRVQFLAYENDGKAAGKITIDQLRTLRYTKDDGTTLEAAKKLEKEIGGIWKDANKEIKETIQKAQRDFGAISQADRGDVRSIGQERGDQRQEERVAEDLLAEPAELFQDDEDPLGSFNPTTNQIKLFENANLSTFQHESAHFFLEMIGTLSQDPAAPQQFKDDWNTIMKWLGVKSKDQIKAKHHEKWAKGYEKYLFEGRAPSVTLRTAFARFRVWMTSVYKSLKNLNVPLTNDVREVMNRMLATDDEIKEVELELTFRPLFSDDPEKFNLRGKKLQAYDKATVAARDETDRIANSRLQQNFEREKKKFLDSERERVRPEIERQIDSRPDYIARSILQKGVMPDGSDMPSNLKPFKLSKQGLKNAFDKEFLKGLPRGISTSDLKEGLHHDGAANILGFRSGEELIIALKSTISRDKIIDMSVESRIRDMHGDLILSRGLTQEAQDAYHNDNRAALLRKDLEHLASNDLPVLKEVIRRVAKPLPPKNAVRDQAQRTIRGIRVRDANPNRFLRSESRFAKEAVDALTKGDFDAAFEAKKKELLNHELYRAAMDVQDGVGKGVKFSSKYNKKKTRERLGKAGGDYLGQIDEIMERFDFRTGVSLRTIDQRKSLVKWMEDQKNNLGIEPQIPDKLLDAAFRTHYKDLTFDEFEGIVEAIKNIDHLSRVKNKLLADKEGREFQASVDELEASIIVNAKGRKSIPRETRLPQQAPVRFGKMFLAMHRKFASLGRQIDGFQDGGAFWELITRWMNEAGDNESEMTAKAAKDMKPITDTYSIAEKTKLYQKEFIPEINENLTRMGMITVGLNWGNLDSRKKVMDGDGWTESQVQAILNRLTRKDLNYIQDVFDFINTFWPQIAALNKRVTGIEPKRVEAEPIVTAVGTIPGGYFPLKYDDRQSEKSFAHKAQELADRAKKGSTIRSTTKHGHRKARVDHPGMPIRKDFGVLFEHVTEVIHDLSHYEFIVDANRLLGNKQIISAIKETHGDIVFRELKGTVDDIAAGSVPAQNAWEQAINWTRNGVSIAALSWNVGTAMLQPLGLTQSMVRIGAKWVGKGVVSWFGDPKKMQDKVKWIHSVSKLMENRALTQLREINEIRNQLSLRGIALGDLENSYFYMIVKMQMIADVPTWLGQYEKSHAELPQANSKEEMKAREARIIALADQAVLDSQSGGQIKDIANIQRGGPFQKLWTNFMSFFISTFNLTAESIGRTNFRKPKDIGRLAVDFLLLYTIPATLGLLIKDGLKGELGEDDLMEKIARENLSFLFGTMIGFRELGSAIQGFYGYSGPAGIRFFGDLNTLAVQVFQGELDEAFWRSLNRVSGSLFHYPAGQVDKTARGFVALHEGRTKNPMVLISGPKSKK